MNLDNDETPVEITPLAVDGVPDAIPIEQTDTNEPVVKAPRIAANVTLTDAVTERPETKGEQPIIALPRYNQDETAKAFEALGKQISDYLQRAAKDPGSNVNDWVENLLTSQGFLPKANAFKGSLERAESDWQQTFEHAGNTYKAAPPKFRPNNGLQGAAQLMQAKQQMKLSSNFSLPLYHTGVWVTVTRPSADQDLVLNEMLAAMKDELGSMTNGLIFSADSYMLNRTIMQHIIPLVVDCSATATEPGRWLMENMLITDLPSLIWGICAVTWMKGFIFSSPCVSEPGSCNYVHVEKLNVKRMQWVDRSQLTEDQRAHMSRRLPAHYAETEIETYQKQHAYHNSKLCTVNLQDNTRALLRVPTVMEYITSGDRWLERIRTVSEAALKRDLTPNERAQLMIKQGYITAMQQFAHFVSSVEIYDLDDGDTADWSNTDKFTSYTDQMFIADLIGSATEDSGMQDAFMNAIGKFVDLSTICLIAVPAFECPECGVPQISEHSKHPQLVPQEVERLFFTLVVHRVAEILQRQ
jgi:hypothetical protein